MRNNAIDPAVLLGAMRRQHPYRLAEILTAEGLTFDALKMRSAGEMLRICDATELHVKAVYGVKAKTTQALIWSALEVCGFDEQAACCHLAMACAPAIVRTATSRSHSTRTHHHADRPD